MHNCHNRCYNKEESSSILPPPPKKKNKQKTKNKKQLTFNKAYNKFQNAEARVEEFNMPNEFDSPQCILSVLLLKFNLEGVVPL